MIARPSGEIPDSIEGEPIRSSRRDTLGTRSEALGRGHATSKGPYAAPRFAALRGEF